jgi:hypothetical protein
VMMAAVAGSTVVTVGRWIQLASILPSQQVSALPAPHATRSTVKGRCALTRVLVVFSFL